MVPFHMADSSSFRSQLGGPPALHSFPEPSSRDRDPYLTGVGGALGVHPSKAALLSLPLRGPGWPFSQMHQQSALCYPAPRSPQGLAILYSNHSFMILPHPLDRNFLKVGASIFTMLFSASQTQLLLSKHLMNELS